jgi:type IV secretory pathway VirB3-like protein
LVSVVVIVVIVVVVVEDVSVNDGMSDIATAVESVGVTCAVLVSGVPITVAVAVVVACACKFVKVSIKERAYLAAGIFILFLLPIIVVTDDSRPFSSCTSHHSMGALGLAVACGCSLAPEIDEVPIAARCCWCCRCRIRCCFLVLNQCA